MGTIRSAHWLSVGFFAFQLCAFAATTGSISGTLMDPSGAPIPAAMVTATNAAQGIQNKTTTDDKGVYDFPSLQVGTYDIKVELQGFKPLSRNHLVVDLDSVLRIDLTVEMAEKIEEVTVLENAVQVETASTQLATWSPANP